MTQRASDFYATLPSHESNYWSTKQTQLEIFLRKCICDRCFMTARVEARKLVWIRRMQESDGDAPDLDDVREDDIEKVLKEFQ
jgi:hypothetical protein